MARSTAAAAAAPVEVSTRQTPQLLAAQVAYPGPQALPPTGLRQVATTVASVRLVTDWRAGVVEVAAAQTPWAQAAMAARAASRVVAVVVVAPGWTTLWAALAEPGGAARSMFPGGLEMSERYVVVTDGVVVNALLADAPLSSAWMRSDDADIGWVMRDGTLVPPVHEPSQPAPPVVPQSVSRAQGKAALIQAGYWQGVMAFVAAIEDETQRALAEVALNDTQEWRRDSPFLNAAAAALGLSTEQLDALFVAAREIQL